MTVACTGCEEVSEEVEDSRIRGFEDSRDSEG